MLVFRHNIVFIPKYRRQALYKELRRHLGEVFRSLAQQRESRIEEGHLMADHVHMLISIPPKYSVAQVIGFIKGSPLCTSPGAIWKASEHDGPKFLGARALRDDGRS